jgi:hypothetical protein
MFEAETSEQLAEQVLDASDEERSGVRELPRSSVP